jgi:DNA invertase Pin-like site-specific DNA recombinase
MGLEQFKAFAKGYEKKENQNKAVWIYTRVSSKDQEANKSLRNQEESAMRLAAERNFLVTNKFGGTYESASGDFTRKEFTKLFNEVKAAKNKPYAILLNTISRFSRTGGSGISLAHQLVDQLGVNLIEIVSGKSTETEDGKLEIYR